jgi:hypothetical protein
MPDARSEKEARPELDVCLASWQAKNVGVEAYVLPSRAAQDARALQEGDLYAGSGARLGATAPLGVRNRRSSATKRATNPTAAG